MSYTFLKLARGTLNCALGCLYILGKSSRGGLSVSSPRPKAASSRSRRETDSPCEAASDPETRCSRSASACEASWSSGNSIMMWRFRGRCGLLLKATAWAQRVALARITGELCLESMGWRRRSRFASGTFERRSRGRRAQGTRQVPSRRREAWPISICAG